MKKNSESNVSTDINLPTGLEFVASINQRYFEFVKDFAEAVIKLYVKQNGMEIVPDFKSEEIFEDRECLKTLEDLKHDIFSDGYDDGYNDGYADAEMEDGYEED